MRMALALVPEFVTDAAVPGVPVEVVPTETLAPAPMVPCEPWAPVSP